MYDTVLVEVLIMLVPHSFNSDGNGSEGSNDCDNGNTFLRSTLGTTIITLLSVYKPGATPQGR